MKKIHKSLYAAAAEPGLIEVPSLPVLAADGAGDPNGPDFAEVVGKVMGVAWATRFALKNAGVLEYSVGPLEALWWRDDVEGWPTDGGGREHWRWTVLVVQPAEATDAVVKEAVEKKGVDGVRFEPLEEGLSAQILHSGPFAEEGPTVDRLHAFIEESGHRIAGYHHEIYLTDPRKTAPEKMRTVIRYPVAKLGG